MTDAPGCDTHAMVVVHRVFRREFRLLPALVASVAAGDSARAELVGAHAAELIDVLHHHHSAEDELIWPLLRDRPEIDAQLVERMEGQHERIAEILGGVERLLLPTWRSAAMAGTRDALAAQLDLVYVALDEHLDDEESRVLPIVARTLTRRQWQAVSDRGMSSIPRKRLIVFLGHILEEADPRERTAFLARVPLPGRLGYRLVGHRTYLREVAALRGEFAH